jgi:hypothetical protein
LHDVYAFLADNSGVPTWTGWFLLNGTIVLAWDTTLARIRRAGVSLVAMRVTTFALAVSLVWLLRAVTDNGQPADPSEADGRDSQVTADLGLKWAVQDEPEPA